MPRQPRIDAPESLFHIMVRGIERSEIFIDDHDRDFFMKRLGKILSETGSSIHTFSLMPNHFHLLLRREKTPLPTVMQRLLTGYALYFNKRHDRVGHLFQNRYKSILCREETYYRTLIRYINLNPLRSGNLRTLSELDSYKYCGHSFIISNRRIMWFDRKVVLLSFGSSVTSACSIYRCFIEAGQGSDEPNEANGGDSKNGPNFAKKKHNSQTGIREECVVSVQRKDPCPGAQARHLIEMECEFYDVSVEELLNGVRSRPVSAVRRALVVKMTNDLGFSQSEAARQLSLSKSSISMIMRRLDEEGL